MKTQETNTQPPSPKKGWVGYLIEDEIRFGNINHVLATKIEVTSFGKKRGTAIAINKDRNLLRELWNGMAFATDEDEIKTWIKTEMANRIAKAKENAEFRMSRGSLYNAESVIAALNGWNPELVEINFR